MNTADRPLHRTRRAALAALAATVVLASAPPPIARAAPPRQVLSNVVPFLGVFVGWAGRNRVYRDANAFIADRNRYYDSLRATARRQLADREISGLRDSQVAAYTKLVALVERNRQAEIEQAEARKRGARAAFHRRLEGVLLQRVLGTDALQRVFGALSKGINRGQNLIDVALDKVGGGGGGILAEAERIRRIARDVESVAGMIGGPTGAGLRRAAGRIAATIERPQQMIQADLEQVKSEIAGLGQSVDTLARAGRTPSAGALAQGILLRTPEGSGDPAVEAISILVSKLSVGNGSLRDQARAAIDAGFLARCVAIANAYREALERLDEEGEVSDVQAVAPCQAIDPQQLVQEAQQTEAVREAATEGSPTGDGTPVPAVIEIVADDVSESNCFVSSVNGWSFCDVTITFEVLYETPSLPSIVRCYNMSSSLTVQADGLQGTASLTVFKEAKNMSLVGARGAAACELHVGAIQDPLPPNATDHLE